MTEHRYDVRLLDEVEAWLLGVDDDLFTVIAATVDALAEHGPTLGRPRVAHVTGSRIHTLKELRPPSTSVRILFTFDPQRRVVLLVAGDKRGPWKAWYRPAITLAEQRYDEWLAGVHDEENQ